MTIIVFPLMSRRVAVQYVYQNIVFSSRRLSIKNFDYYIFVSTRRHVGNNAR